jgi:NAD kinase
MALTHEKAFKLTKIMNADKERAKFLLALDPSETTKKINALGHNFTVEEIHEYRCAIISYMGDSINNYMLDDVSGGITFDFPVTELFSDKIK